MSNVAVYLAKAQQDGADHAFDEHGIGSHDAISFDVFTDAMQQKVAEAAEEAEAATLGLTRKRLLAMRLPPLPLPPEEEPNAELVAAREEIQRLQQELAALQQQANRKQAAERRPRGPKP